MAFRKIFSKINTMKMKINGEATEAQIMEAVQVDNDTYEQIGKIADHEAFRNDIRIMPDTHWGKGCVIGFTMPLGDRVVPNTIGVDIGCGMLAFQLKDDQLTNLPPEIIDEEIRKQIPFGRYVHDEPLLDMKDDFPWNNANIILGEFMNAHYGEYLKDHSDVPEQGYSYSYFEDLCEKVGYDEDRAKNSLGTLGGGNHFIELAKSEKDESTWCVIHSGSRGIGKSIAEYWQDRAINDRKGEVSLDEVPDRYAEYMTDEWKPKADEIREDFEGEKIQEMFDAISRCISKYGTVENEDLAYLEGENAAGYYVDMIFAQQYASLSRRLMAGLICDVLDTDSVDSIESVHNFIDFEDGIIRKGATSAHEGERIVIPFNMKDGTIICRGKGNEEWNYSAPHGAGRIMGRREAKRKLNMEDVEHEMKGIETTNIPLDEAPHAYKKTKEIEEAISPTAEIIDRLVPIHNLKA